MLTASVVIPAFNASVSIARAVRSALAQSLTDIEILVVDDGSSDGTRDAVMDLAQFDPRVRLLAQHTNLGVSAARNRGIAESRGEWIAILDADDAFLPERLERLIGIGVERNADLVADDILYFDWHLDDVVGRGLGNDDGTVEDVTTAAMIASSMPGTGSFEFSLLKVVYRAAFLRASGVTYIEGLKQGEDFMMYAEALLAGARLLLVHQALYLYTESVGRKSRKSSQLSRTIENCREMRRSTLTLLDHPVVRHDRGLADLLRKRGQAIRWYESWERIYQPLQRRDATAVLRVILTDWRAAWSLGREMYRRAGFHLRSRVEPDIR